MRIEPVGHDSEKSTYWNFNDERLYKETKPPEPPKEKHKYGSRHVNLHLKIFVLISSLHS